METLLLNRTLGCETEYSALDKSEKLPPEQVAISLMSCKQNHFRTDFIENGGRLYVDNEHPEYATPECLNPLEAARYHHAGDLLLRELKDCLAEKGLVSIIHRDNVDWAETSYGCHENYLVLRNIAREQLYNSLTPFLISSQILFGSGWIRPSGTFCFSVRDHILDLKIAKDTTQGKRAIISSRDNSYLPRELEKKYRRLHIACHDSNVSQTATYVKLGTTCLVLAAIEAGYDFSHLLPVDPVAVMKVFNSDLALHHRVDTPMGEKSALDMQWEIARIVADFLSAFKQELALPSWVPEVYSLWIHGLCDLREFSLSRETEPSSSHWIDWWIKWRLFNLYRKAEPRADPATLFAISLLYHNIDPGTNLSSELEGFWQNRFSQEELRKAAHSPSSHPRAQERASYLPKLGCAQYNVSRLDWVEVIIDRQPKPFSFF